MRQGLALLPFVHQAREHDWSYVRCSECLSTVDRATRATYRCGWMAQSEWVPGLMPIPSDVPDRDSVTVCPGYSTTLPQVLETGRWYAWFEKGEIGLRLRALQDEPTPLLVQCIESLVASIGELRSATDRRLQQKG